MRITKNQRSNLIFLAFAVVLLLTPVGKNVKIWVNRLVALSPGVEAVADRVIVKDYHWELQSLNESSFNLKEEKGKVILLHIWATWCPSCLAELPGLQTLYDKYKDRVSFVFISDEPIGKVTSFMVEKGYDFPIYIPVTRSPDIFRSRRIPATYMIDKKGAVVIKEIGVADWNTEKVKHLIDELLLN